MAAGVPDGEVTAPADAGDGPAVAVLHPVGGGEAEAAVVAAGDDHISDTGLVPIGQTHLGCRLGVIKAMRPGTAVELGDQVPGGGEHDGVKSGRPVGSPGGEGVFGGLGYVADVDAIVIEVEVECFWFAFAEGE